MADEIVYRIRSDDTLAHAYVSPYKNSSGSSGYKRTTTEERYGVKTENVIGRKKAGYKYGSYKSPYYDPVARHERYLRERSKLGIGKGTTSLTSGGKGRSGGKGGSGGKGKKGKSGGRGNAAAALASEIQKLQDTSSLETEAQQEAARRKILDLKAALNEQVNMLKNKEAGELAENGLNTAEIRANIQSLKSQIQQTGTDLNTWVANERKALENRVAELYKKRGVKYQTSEQKQKDKEQASKKREKEVASKADAIYKRRTS